MNDKKTSMLISLGRALVLLIFMLAMIFAFNQLGIPSKASESVISPGPTSVDHAPVIYVSATETAIAERIARFTPPPLPTLRLLPTATLLPDRGVRSSLPQALRVSGDVRVPNDQFYFVPASADINTIVGTTGVPGRTAIVAVDISSGITRFLGEKPGSVVQVSGKYVVWRNESPANEFSIYDLDQGQIKNLTLSFDIVRDPRISGSTLLLTGIVQQNSGPTSAFWIYDLATQKDFSLGVTGQDPEISGDWIVYRGHKTTSQVELKAMNIRTKEEIVLGSAPPPGQYGDMRYRLYDISLPWVAWGAGALDPEPLLHLYNLETHQTRTVSIPGCVHPLSQRKGGAMEVQISKDIVIFQCITYMGYHIRRNVFFTIPVQQPKTEDDGLVKWVLASDQVVWLWHANVNGGEENRVYTSRISETSPYP